MSDYLFDKQGEPDPEIARLEGLLAPLGHRGAAPVWPARSRVRSRRPFVVAAALTAMAAAIVALLIARPWRPAPTWLDSGAGMMHLAIGDIGSVDLEPHTRARVVAGGPAPHTVELARGTLHATIAARPRQFAVVTPHAVVTDLGCAFDVTVDEAGRGQVVVREGRVGVATDGAAEVVVPAGARVELTERGVGELHGSPTRPAMPATPAPSVQPAPSPPSVQPAPSPPSAQPARHPTHPAPPRHATKPPAKTAPPAAPPARTPAKKPAPPASGIRHDPLQELQRSVE